MKDYEGPLDARGLSFAVVASRFNETIVASLERSATATLVRLGADRDRIAVFRVPGAFEIPAVAARLARSGKFDAVLCLGAVIRGSTPHFEHVAGQAAAGIARAALDSPVPVIFGVLTTDTLEQAVERSGTKAGNKGMDAALAAVEMVNLYRKIEREVERDAP